MPIINKYYNKISKCNKYNKIIFCLRFVFIKISIKISIIIINDLVINIILTKSTKHKHSFKNIDTFFKYKSQV